MSKAAFTDIKWVFVLTMGLPRPHIMLLLQATLERKIYFLLSWKLKDIYFFALQYARKNPNKFNLDNIYKDYAFAWTDIILGKYRTKSVQNNALVCTLNWVWLYLCIFTELCYICAYLLSWDLFVHIYKLRYICVYLLSFAIYVYIYWVVLYLCIFTVLCFICACL